MSSENFSGVDNREFAPAAVVHTVTVYPDSQRLGSAQSLLTGVNGFDRGCR